MTSRLDASIWIVFAAVIGGCTQSDKTSYKKVEPAKVTNAVDELALNKVELTPKAAERLSIRTVEARRVNVRRHHRTSGELIVPPGQTIDVQAPVAGTLLAVDPATKLVAGSAVKQGQPLFRFAPLVNPEREVLTSAERITVAQTRASVATAQLEAQRQIESAKVEVEAAEINHARAMKLFESKAASQATVDDAFARLKLAREALTTANARSSYLATIELDAERGKPAVQTISSPIRGVLQDITVAVGEAVSAGEPLFRVVRLDPIWVRVPVYVGRRSDVDPDREAFIDEYGVSSPGQRRTARYISAPPAANALANSVDFFYELPNADGKLIPGQKLSATLPLRGTQDSLVVPVASVLYDIHGSAWVYEETAPQTFSRRRVDIEFVDSANAVLRSGPSAGTKVVTDGAMELFGTEFGVGK